MASGENLDATHSLAGADPNKLGAKAMLIPTVRVSVAYNSGAAIVIALFAVVISALESTPITTTPTWPSSNAIRNPKSDAKK